MLFKVGHGSQQRGYEDTLKRVEALVGVKAKQVACGRSHIAVCIDDGRVYTFGEGNYGQLGQGDRRTRSSPALVKSLEGKHITQVQCGRGHHTMALASSGYVFTWGSAKRGQLGHGNNKSKLLDLTIPCLVEGLCKQDVAQISSGYLHCAVIVDTKSSVVRESQQATFNNKEHSDVVLLHGRGE